MVLKAKGLDKEEGVAAAVADVKWVPPGWYAKVVFKVGGRRTCLASGPFDELRGGGGGGTDAVSTESLETSNVAPLGDTRL